MTHVVKHLIGATSPLMAAALLASALSATTVAAAPDAFPIPRPVTRSLSNGLTAAVFHDARLPMVRVHVLVPAGVLLEPEHQAGIARVTSDLLLRGTASRNLGTLFYEIDGLGAVLGLSATRDVATIAGQFLASDFDAGLELIADCVRNPIFDALAVEGVKEALNAEVTRALRDPSVIAERELWSSTFRGHPYARSSYGSATTRRALDVEAIRFFHRTRYAPEQTIVAIAGDIDPERAFQAIEDRFGNWATIASPLTAPAVPEAPRKVRLVDVELPQAVLAVGVRGPSRGHADEMAIAVASQLLGGPGSRFDAQLSEGALTREVRVSWSAQRDGGLLTLAATVATDSVAIVVEQMLAALDDLAAHPPTDAELAPILRRAINTYPMRFETLAAVLGRWSEGRFDGLPEDFFEREHAALHALKPEAVAAAIGRWLDTSRASVVAVGAASAIRSQLQRFGPVDAATGFGGITKRRAPTADQKARGRDLVSKAIAAHGGVKRFKQIKDSTIDAAATLMSGTLEIEGRFRQIRRESFQMVYASEFEGVAAKQTLDGDRAWVASKLETVNVQDMDSLGVTMLRNAYSSDLHHLLLDAMAPDITLSHRGRESIGGRIADAVEVRGSGTDRVLYFDAEDQLLVAMDQHPTGAGGYSARRIYKDFRETEGIKWPYLEERLLDGELKMRLIVVALAFNTGVDDVEFERPEPLEVPAPR